MRMRLLGLILLSLGVMEASAKVITRTVEYKHGDVVLEGILAYDDALQGKAPGVLIVHEWWGRTDYVKQRAEQIAGLGYAAFALDMYGKGVIAKDREQAAKLAGQFYSDKELLRARARAGYDVLAQQPQVDSGKIAVMGYCFGGTTSLQLALDGRTKLAAAVSFHGGLEGVAATEGTPVQAKLLILHGADDPFIKPADIEAFQESLRKAKADWQMIYYGNAVHAFTNPGVDKANLSGARYNAAADQRSWEHMKLFLREVFGQ